MLIGCSNFNMLRMIHSKLCCFNGSLWTFIPYQLYQKLGCPKSCPDCRKTCRSADIKKTYVAETKNEVKANAECIELQETNKQLEEKLTEMRRQITNLDLLNS